MIPPPRTELENPPQIGVPVFGSSSLKRPHLKGSKEIIALN